MNVGAEEQAQRRKKSRRSSRRQKAAPSQQAAIPQEQHQKIYQTKTMQVQQHKIGLIIGQSGKHIRELYKQTHCDIILPKQKKKKEETYDQLDTNEPTYDQGGFYYTYDAYNDTVQTNMNLKDDPPKDKEDEKHNNSKDKDKPPEDEEDDRNRLVEIKLRGTPEEIRDAELEINFMVQNGRLMLDHERSGDTKKKRVSTGRKKKSNEAKDEDHDEWEDELAEDIRIPSKICGMLIGGGGQRVKDLADETGAEIWVDWDRESHMEAGVSTVHLKGTKYAVEYAKQEIRRIQNLFEKGSNTYRFEIPAFSSNVLFGDNGANLKMLQKQYNVSINVKNYRNERNSIRIGNDFERIQRTLMIMLIGEHDDQMACKKGIDKLVGIFVKCEECNNLKSEEDGHADKYSQRWYCQQCWDEFTGVSKVVKDVQDRMQNVHLDDHDGKPPKRRVGQRPNQKGYGGSSTSKSGRDGGGGVKCYSCGETGHFSRD
eukprot:88383_1